MYLFVYDLKDCLMKFLEQMHKIYILIVPLSINVVDKTSQAFSPAIRLMYLYVLICIQIVPGGRN